MRYFSILLALLLGVTLADGATILVPSETATIQAGIDGAAAGDTVLVAPGVYVENIDFNGKTVKLLSSGGAELTTIRASNSSEAVVYMNSGEPKGTEITGFTITGGGQSGIYCGSSSPRIANNIFVGNQGSNRDGGGIGLNNTSGAVVWGNTFHGNSSGYGASMHVDGGQHDTIAYNIMYDNTGDGEIAMLSPCIGVEIFNNTIVPDAYAGIKTQDGASAHARNNIIFGSSRYAMQNQGAGINAEYNCTFDNAVADYSDVTLGVGNIYDDALLLDPDNGDFSLTPGSPCIDAGDPDPFFNDSDGSRNDMGAGTLLLLPLPSELSFQDADFGHVIDHEPTLTWTFYDTVGSQSGHEMEVGTDRDWSAAELWSTGPVFSGSSEIQYAGGELVDGQTYVFRLRIYNGLTWGSWTERAFHLNATTAPIIRGPMSGQSISVSSVRLSVYNANDLEGDSLSYDFELYSDRSAMTVLDSDYGVSEQVNYTRSKLFIGLLVDTEYWWRGRSFDSLEYSEWSPIDSFVTVDAGVINVPTEQPTIQAGINASINGDLILVAPGLYVENINFNGKAVKLRSSGGAESTTIQAASSSQAVVYMTSGELKGTEITGFTITGGGQSGIYCSGSSPRIANNIFVGNQGSNRDGGGIGLNNTSGAVVWGNTFHSNSSGYGASMHVDGGQHDTIAYNIMYDNTGDGEITVLYPCESLEIFNNTIVPDAYAGIKTQDGASAHARNNIIFGSSRYAMQNEGAGIDAEYNCTFGNAVADYFNVSLGAGNIYDDALLLDPDNGDFSLTPESPCIDAGDPNPFFYDPDGSRNDMGALASDYQSYSGPVWYVSTIGDDITGDGSDLLPFATIQHACDMALDNDTVMVTPGTYGGEGNRDISFGSKRLHVTGQQGSANTIIDVQGEAYQGFTTLRSQMPDSASSIIGLTIRNALYGVQLEMNAIRLIDIRAENCSAAGMVLSNVYPIEMSGCFFTGNYDGLFLGEYPSYGVFDSCSFADNVNCGVFINYIPPESGNNCIIRQCDFTNNGNGIASGGRSQVYAPAITVDSCRFEQNDVAIKSSGVFSGATITNNDCAVELYYHYCEIHESIFSQNDVDLARLGNLFYDAASELKLFNCRLSGNVGGIVRNEGEHRYLTMSGCLFDDNGGSINLYSSNACWDEISGNSFVANLNNVFVVHEGNNFSADLLTNNVIAGNQGYGLYGDGVLTESMLSLSCNNVFGNAAGEYGGGLGDSTSYSGNISTDPLFCDAASDNFNILNLSPCAPANNSCSTLIGACGVGCYAPVVDSVTVDPDADNFHVVSHQPSIVWNYYHDSESQQTQFEIEVGTDNDWAVAELWDFGPQVSADTAATYAGDSLYDGQTYYLRLRAHDETWWSLWHESSFRMNTSPVVPEVLSPPEGGVSGLIPELWIANASDPEADSLSYDFELYMDLAMEWIVKDTQGLVEQPDSTGWNTGVTLTDNEPFWWRTRTHDGYEHSEWSDLAVFWVNGTQQPPSAPETILPPDTSGLPVWDMLPTFTWSEASDPDPFDTLFYYMLEIAVDSNFMYKNDIDSIWATNYELADSLAFNTRYWWRVSACDATDLCTRSEPGNFWTWTLGDMDHTHVADITDLSILIDNQFLTLTPIYPAFVADVTGDCAVDISDVSRFIDHLFLTLSTLEVGCE